MRRIKLIISCCFLVLFLTGCSLTDRNRNWFSSNTVGADPKIARDAVQTTLVLDETKRKLDDTIKVLDVVKDEVKEIRAENKKVSSAVNALVKADESKVVEVVNAKFKPIDPGTPSDISIAIKKIDDNSVACLKSLGESVDNIDTANDNIDTVQSFVTRVYDNAQGKEYRSKTEILMYQVIGVSVVILLLGFALNYIGLLPAIRTIVKNITMFFARVATGKETEFREGVLEMVEKNQGLNTNTRAAGTSVSSDPIAEVPLSLREEIIKRNIRKKKENNV